VSSTDASVFTSQNDAVATVGESTGVVTGVAEGTVIITVTRGGFTGQSTVTVNGTQEEEPPAIDWDPAACCPSAVNADDATDINMCYAGGPTPPGSADPDCPMVQAGGYCANPSDSDYSQGDWVRGYNEAHTHCCDYHPGAAGCP
jgi:hypothetical protein